MLSSSSSLFTSLPARPPTPPKDIQEHVKDALDFLENGHEEADENASNSGKLEITTDTPPGSSPVSSQEVNAVSNAAKKVGFSPFPPTYHEVPQIGVSSSPRDRLLRSTPRPRISKPVKSILKLSSFAPPPTPDEHDHKIGYFSPEDPSTFGKMLQSVLKELASSSRSSRLDAYLALHGALTAYDGIPDRQAMAANMAQIQQYLSRDLIWRESGSLIDTQVATQALKLACTLVFDNQLSKALDDDFRIFLIDRSITVMEQPEIPKALVKTHLYLVAQQKFHHSIITPNRAERMISALRTIEDRCSGNSLIATRLVIYQRLLDQAPVVMCNRLRDWLEHVFHGMLSSINDTKMRAIEVGNHAGLKLGTNAAASKALEDLFDIEVEEGQTYCDYLALRLTGMMTDKQKQTGVLVPQIWSAIVLFFRTKRRPLERWPRLRTWLQVLQKCLNSSDVNIKYQANLAWKKLVFAVMPDASTGPTMLSMLRVPISAGFEKRSGDRISRQARQIALDGYHNLLHYGMRPSLSHADLDVTWDAYVHPILLEMIKASPKGRLNACKILHGLLSPNAGLWNEFAAMESTAIQSHDLPRIDSRWVRSRLAKVLTLVEPIMSAELWNTQDDNILATKVWKQTLQSIAEAGAQEVKTSNELREALAMVMNMFQRLWGSSLDSDEHKSAITSEFFQEMVRTTCQYIGPSLLAEDMLARSPQGDVEAAPTPSHRPSKHQHALYSPLVFTLSMMCTQPHQSEGSQWRSLAAEVIELSCKSTATSAARLQLVNRTLQALQALSVTEDAKEQIAKLWTLFAQRATEALCHSKTESTPSGMLGQKLRDALNILVYGLPLMKTDATNIVAGHALIEEMILVARCKAGDAGVTLAVVEPVSKALLDKDRAIEITIEVHVAAVLFNSAGWPQNRQAMEQGRKLLWGVGSGPLRAGTFDPYEHAYGLIKDLFDECYSGLKGGAGCDHLAIKVLNAFQAFVSNCPLALLVNTLRQIQSGVALWLEDGDRVVFSGQHVAEATIKLWGGLLSQIAGLPRKDGALLSLLQPLFVAGFASPKRSIVNRTITFWNENFGDQETLRYPAKLEKVLRAALSHVELDLPDFPEKQMDDELIELPAFSGQQDAESQIEPESTSISRWTGLPRGTASPAKQALVPHEVSSHLPSISTGGTHSASKPTSKGTTSKARLRHDDSQIMFAPIDSSPLPAADESQLLTDHQKEVRARQNEDAQMFPDLSSTPARKQTPHVRRRPPGPLAFSADVGQEPASDAVARSPLEMPDEQNEMSGYLGSSPTPRSSDKSTAEQFKVDATAQEDEHEDDEISSSPPRSPYQAGEKSEAGGKDQKTSFVADSVHDKDESSGGDAAKEDANEEPADLDPASDDARPAAQLQMEADAAEHHGDLNDDAPGEAAQVDATTFVEPTEVFEQATGGNDDQDGLEMSRIENSFLEPDAGAEPAVELSPAGSHYSTRSARKRKRASAAAESLASKKQKHQSPLRRVMSGIFGSSQKEEEEDGDEIVVASSQPTDSPTKVEPQQQTEGLNEGIEESVASVTSSQRPKRGRGRPRKSETPTPLPTSNTPASSTRAKRKALALSEGDAAGSSVNVGEEPAPAPKRQRRRARAKKAIEGARKSQEASQEEPDSRPPSRREATGVIIDQPESDVDVSQTRLASDDEAESGADGKTKPVEPAATPSKDRPKATPKSILGRLRDVLVDCSNAIFGSQEEREFDDILFRLRQEVHGAAYRGRST